MKERMKEMCYILLQLLSFYQIQMGLVPERQLVITAAKK